VYFTLGLLDILLALIIPLQSNFTYVPSRDIRLAFHIKLCFASECCRQKGAVTAVWTPIESFSGDWDSYYSLQTTVRKCHFTSVNSNCDLSLPHNVFSAKLRKTAQLSDLPVLLFI